MTKTDERDIVERLRDEDNRIDWRDTMQAAADIIEAHLRTPASGGAGEMVDWLAKYIESLPLEWARNANEGRADPDITPEFFADSKTLKNLRAILTRLSTDTEAMRLLREKIRLFPEAHDTLTNQEMRDAKGNWRSLIDQQTNALRELDALAKGGAS